MFGELRLGQDKSAALARPQIAGDFVRRISRE
jgi:hypothetical protein